MEQHLQSSECLKETIETKCYQTEGIIEMLQNFSNTTELTSHKDIILQRFDKSNMICAERDQVSSVKS